MGLLDFFKTNNQQANFWKHLESENDLKNAIEHSYEARVILFKHSTRCYISRTMLSKFQSEVLEHPNNDWSYYLLDILKKRNLSNFIADNFAIKHQSPQIIVLENGKAIHVASHEKIKLLIT